MRCKSQLLSGIVAFTLVVPAAASAQEAPTAFASLPGTLEPGAGVIVTEVGGRKTRGDVLDVRETSITVRVRDRWGSEERRRFDESVVESIRRTDPVWNGLIIGLGAGLIASEVWRHSECGPRGYDTECSAIVSVIGLATMVPGGAVAGALIDKYAGNELVYRSPGSRATLQLSPVFGRGGAALKVRLGF